MRRLLLAALIVTAVVGVALPVSAAPPVPSGTISINETGPYAFGDTITFTTTVSHLKASTWPMVLVSCYAADDPSLLLQGMLDTPDAGFLLGGSWSPWWGNPNHDGTCVAELLIYSRQAGGVAGSLAQTETFPVTGP